MAKVELPGTTLRDGAQGEGIQHSIDDKHTIAVLPGQLGIPLLEGGNPFGNPRDKAFFAQAKASPFLRWPSRCP